MFSVINSIDTQIYRILIINLR